MDSRDNNGYEVLVTVAGQKTLVINTRPLRSAGGKMMRLSNKGLHKEAIAHTTAQYQSVACSPVATTNSSRVRRRPTNPPHSVHEPPRVSTAHPATSHGVHNVGMLVGGQIALRCTPAHVRRAQKRRHKCNALRVSFHPIRSNTAETRAARATLRFSPALQKKEI